jgi:hypothetical protein
MLNTNYDEARTCAVLDRRRAFPSENVKAMGGEEIKA